MSCKHLKIELHAFNFISESRIDCLTEEFRWPRISGQPKYISSPVNRSPSYRGLADTASSIHIFGTPRFHSVSIQVGIEKKLRSYWMLCRGALKVHRFMSTWWQNPPKDGMRACSCRGYGGMPWHWNGARRSHRGRDKTIRAAKLGVCSSFLCFLEAGALAAVLGTSKAEAHRTLTTEELQTETFC